MEFDDLVQYGVLAEELNFRRAAARLGISQPSLSRRIRRLEREIGAYLVERHSRRIRLTAAGEIFAERAAWIAHELATLKLELADAGRGVLGRLAVGFLTSLSSDVFRRVLPVFASNGDLRLELREGTARQQLVALRQHRIDLALTFGPIDDPELNTESLWSERLTAVAPADHPVVVRKSLTWPALTGERLIVRASEHDHSVADYVCGLAASAGCRPLITEFLTTRENMVGLVRAGFRHRAASGVERLEPEHRATRVHSHVRPWDRIGDRRCLAARERQSGAAPLLGGGHFGCSRERGSAGLWSPSRDYLFDANRALNSRSDRMNRSSMAGISRSTVMAPKLAA